MVKKPVSGAGTRNRRAGPGAKRLGRNDRQSRGGAAGRGRAGREGPGLGGQPSRGTSQERTRGARTQSQAGRTAAPDRSSFSKFVLRPPHSRGPASREGR